MAHVTAATAHQTYQGTASGIVRAETEAAKPRPSTVIINERVDTISSLWTEPDVGAARALESSGDSYMAGKNTAAYGLYSDRVQVEEAIDAFVKARFRPEDISVLFPDNEGTKDFAHEKNTKAPEGTAAGVSAGGAIGGTLGLLVGLGALAIPGLGPFIAAGPIMAALAGMGAGGAVGGLV